MAVSGGDEPRVPQEQIDRHLAGCESCREEIGLPGDAAAVLTRFERNDPEADLWPGIAPRIAKHGWSGWQVFAALCIALAGYKLFELLPDNYPGHFLKIAPILAAAALFIFLKENPFKINTELTTE